MSKSPKVSCSDCSSRSQSVFCELEKGDLDHLDLSKTCNIYKKGQVIFHEGNVPMGLFCIQRGKAKIFKTGVDGKDQIVRLASNGDVLGYRALLGEDSYTATATALEECMICFLDRKTLFQLIQENKEFSWKIIQMLSNQLKDAENYLKDMAQKSVRERLAEIILILKNKYGVDNADPTIINAKLTREELASFVGTATETLIRLISDLKNENIIATKGRQIQILNLESLMEIANLDY